MAAVAAACAVPRQSAIGGFAGKRADALLEGRVFSRHAREDVMDEAVHAFETHYDDTHKPGSGYWQGEYWGKTMLGHVGAMRFGRRDEVSDYVLKQVDRLVSAHMAPDGYLGTYKDPRFVVRGWNLWGRKYTLWALLEAYEATGERKALDAAVRTMDQIIAMLDDMKLSMRETGSFNGLASCSIMCPLVKLYRHVPKPEYRRFMDSIVKEWEREDGAKPNLIANALSGRPVHEWYPSPVVWAKSYEMMSCFEGLVAYAGLVGLAGERALSAAVRFADLLAEHEANAVGAVGYYDHFTHAAANPNATVEMCDVVYWMRLCHALYRATGETRHLDRAEKAFCNAYLAGIHRSGTWGAFSVRAHGSRHGTAPMEINMRHHVCCVDNAPRGFYDFADNAVVRCGGVVEVNHYLPFRTDLGDGVEVRIEGNYPVSEDARINVKSPVPVKLSLRVPGWCGRMEVDGREVVAQNGRVSLEAGAGASLAVRFAMPARIVHRPDVGPPALASGHECDGKGNDGALFLFELPKRFPEMRGLGRSGMAAYVMRGPLILAKSSRLGLVEREIFAPGTVNGDSAWSAEAKPSGAEGFWGVWELTLRKGGETRTVKVCDFASASSDDDWQGGFSVWF